MLQHSSQIADGHEPAGRLSKAQLRWRLHLLLVAADATTLVVALLLAGALRFGALPAPAAVRLLMLLLPMYGVTAFSVNAYSTAALLDSTESMRRGAKALGFALTAAVFLLFLRQVGQDVSRATFAAGAGLSLAGLAAVRWFASRHATGILGGHAYEVMVICDGVRSASAHGRTVFVDAEGLDLTQQTPATFDRLGRLAERADRVVVACPPERRQLWAAALQGANVQGEVLAPELSALRPLGIAHHGDATTVIVARSPLSLRDRVLKRALDVAVAGTLLVLLCPLMLAIAIAIKLDDRGPVLFRQPRIGQRNRQFRIMKFRTMRPETADSAGDRSAARGDSRVTRVGRLLRATSLDELPQLLNVLRGEMSMVGPRPHALGSRAGDHLFWELDSRYWDRHAIKPGVTGLAQIRGFRGATVASADLTNRLHADLEYRVHWSLWRDIVILLRTAPALIGRNAF